MTRRASRPCATPGCPTLTPDRSGLCVKHLAERRAHTDANRPTSHARGYGTAHRAATVTAKARGQTCQVDSCGRADVHRDHIDGDPRNNATFNIQWLCRTHHSAKTLKHDVERDNLGRILPTRTNATTDNNDRQTET
jgi:hypothetical protein